MAQVTTLSFADMDFGRKLIDPVSSRRYLVSEGDWSEARQEYYLWLVRLGTDGYADTFRRRRLYESASAGWAVEQAAAKKPLAGARPTGLTSRTEARWPRTSPGRIQK